MPEASRLRLVVLVHMPLGHRPADHAADDARAREHAVLAVATAVVTTSEWARRRLLELYSLPADRVHVAEPAVDAADLAAGTATGGALLCVAAVTSEKGHDVLLDALATTADLPWNCVCVGSLDREPAFVEGLRRRSLDAGLDDRVFFPGPRTGADLDRTYAVADVLVLASRAETFGMVVTEALARGLPVVAAEVGGLPEALGHGAEGIRPGLLVPPGDPAALGAALRAWLGDAELRGRLRRAARERRESLAGWPSTTVRPRGCPGRGVAMTVEDIRVSWGWLALREPADAAARSLDLVEHLAPTTCPPAGCRVIHDLGAGTGGDGALARAVAPRAAALGRARPRRRPAGGRGRRPARPGRRRERGHRRDEAVRHHRAGHGRSRRRKPGHGLGAAGHADWGRAGRAGRRLCRAQGVPCS